MAAPTDSKRQSVKICEEVVFASVAGNEDKPWNVGVWDLHTGNLLQTFKNGSAIHDSLCMVGGECLMAASSSKPVIHVWNMLRQSQKHRKLIMSSKLTCLSATSDHKLIAAGIEDKIHIWQLCTGNLLSVLSYGSVEVNCLRFSPRGHHLVSGYKDGTVCVWELQDALFIDPRRMMDHTPVQTFRGHAGEIADIHICLSNNVVSCGTDYTVRIWSLLSGEELKMFELGAPVVSVTMDHTELALFAGDSLGNVYCIDLQKEMRSSEKSAHFDARNSSDGFVCHAIHTAAVRFLALTQNQSRLVSASDDKTIKIWSIMSSASPLSIVLNERITNLMVVPIPSALVSPDLKPSVHIANLKRHLHGTEKEENDSNIVINIPSQQPRIKLFGARPVDHEEANDKDKMNVTVEEVSSLREKASKLKKMNEEIYKYAVKAIVK